MALTVLPARWPSAPKSLQPILNDARVRDFSDERAYEQGYWVYLRPGWNWDGCHCVHEDTVAQVRAEFARIERCEAGCDCGWDKTTTVKEA